MVIPERLLQRMHMAVSSQTLNGQQLTTIGLYGEEQAGTHAVAIEDHCARTTHAMFAAEVGRGQSKIFAQEIREELTYLDLAFDFLAIDAEADRLAIGEL